MEAFCRPSQPNGLGATCVLKAQLGTQCTMAGTAAPYQEVRCVKGASCQLPFGQGPPPGTGVALGQCQPAAGSATCFNDSGCPLGQFCRQANAGVTSMQCFPAGNAGDMCNTDPASPPYQWLKCKGSFICQADYSIGGNGLQYCEIPGIMDQTCQSDQECGVNFFCRQISANTNVNMCVQRALQGQPCTMDGYVPEWEEVQCTTKSRCNQNFAQYPEKGGACQDQQYLLPGLVCMQDADCGTTSFCRRQDPNQPLPPLFPGGPLQPRYVCYPYRLDGETCTSDPYALQWAVAKCLSTYQCMTDPLNPKNGICRSPANCATDRDCNPGQFCRQMSSLQSQCVTRSGAGQPCTIQQYQVTQGNVNACMSGMWCWPVDASNPSMGGICQGTQACINDLDCGQGGFCKQDTDASPTRLCYPRASQGAFCTIDQYVPAWSSIHCQIGFQCVPFNANQPQGGGSCQAQTGCDYCAKTISPVCYNGKEYKNSCVAKCEGVPLWTDGPCSSSGCHTDKDCGSTSMFCKRSMPDSNVRTCFTKAEEGQDCNFAEYVYEWELQVCLDVFTCVPWDANNRAKAGTCQSAKSRCISDAQCTSRDMYCTQVTGSSPFKSCMPRKVAGEACTISGASLPQNAQLCLLSLYCFPINFLDLSLGGTCGGSPACFSCPNTFQPVCASGLGQQQQFQNPCFAQCFGAYNYHMGPCPPPGNGYGPNIPYQFQLQSLYPSSGQGKGNMYPPGPSQGPYPPGPSQGPGVPQYPPSSVGPSVPLARPPNLNAGTCRGVCGSVGLAGGCFCDSQCSTRGDCCTDFWTQCQTVVQTFNSCVGRCYEGYVANRECYCDAACTTDCCYDKQQICGGAPRAGSYRPGTAPSPQSYVPVSQQPYYPLASQSQSYYPPQQQQQSNSYPQAQQSVNVYSPSPQPYYGQQQQNNNFYLSPSPQPYSYPQNSYSNSNSFYSSSPQQVNSYAGTTFSIPNGQLYPGQSTFREGDGAQPNDDSWASWVSSLSTQFVRGVIESR